MLTEASRRSQFVRTCALFTVILASAADAGPLSPPIGPVAPTAKPLAEVEPRIAINATNTPGDNDASPSLFKITQPGSYYLTGNITGVSSKRGIEIAASGVTIDLNGFDVAGVSGSLDGVVVATSGLFNITVLNGSIRDWGGDGLDLAQSSTNGKRIERIIASGNGESGIRSGTGCVVSDCIATGNTAAGISTSGGCTVTRCSATSNGGAGIVVLSGSTVSDCSALSNGGTGIVANDGCTVTNCSAMSSGSDGISTTANSTVSGCTSKGNTGNGIACTTNCVITGNTCVLNGLGAGDAAGIATSGSRNHIEGNRCLGADRGIDINSTGNLIIRNTCSGNTVNWQINPGNAYGPIVVTLSNAAIISGSGPVASTLNSTDPNANFSY